MQQFNLSSEENIEWYRKMVETFENTLSEQEKEELKEWEKENE